MEEFYEVIEDISDTMNDIDLVIEDVWTSGEDIVPDEYAEDFENAVSYYATAKHLIDKIYIKLFEKRHDED